MGFQRLSVFLVVLALPVVAGAQENPPDPTPLVINLAEGQVQTLDIDAGTYQIKLVNAVPGRGYFLRIGPSQSIALPVLTRPGSAGSTKLDQDESEGCTKVYDATTELATVTQETDVAGRVEAVRLALASAGKCGETRADAAKVVDSTRPDFPTAVTVTAEAVRDLTVSSGLGSNWRIRLNSAGRGTWQSSYGFVFNPNHDEDYFTEAASNGAFAIRRKARDENSLTFLPSVFYSWLSSEQAFNNIQHGPTLGVGLTTDGGRIGGLVGWSIRFNQNIGLTAGVSVYPHRRLDAKYQEGQVVKEPLDSDQLNKDSVRGNIFVAFTLRVGASPFGQ